MKPRRERYPVTVGDGRTNLGPRESFRLTGNLVTGPTTTVSYLVFAVDPRALRLGEVLQPLLRGLKTHERGGIGPRGSGAHRGHQEEHPCEDRESGAQSHRRDIK